MENTQITIADLDQLKTIIELASTRGAFRAAELKEIGDVYDKLTQFLEAVITQAKAQEESQATQTQGE
jgi:pyrroloquinoline quinone (PQQ) biosynthesis protein C